MAGCLSCQVPYDRYLELSLFVFFLLCVLNIWEKMHADQWSCSSIGPLACMTKLAAMIYRSHISTWHTTLIELKYILCQPGPLFFITYFLMLHQIEIELISDDTNLDVLQYAQIVN